GPDGIAHVLYDVPGERVNTLRDTFQQDFHEIFGRLAEDSAVKGVVLASAKPDNFVVGADVEMLARTKNAIEATALARGAQQALQRLEDLGKRKPVVAAIGGPASWPKASCASSATRSSSSCRSCCIRRCSSRSPSRTIPWAGRSSSSRRARRSWRRPADTIQLRSAPWRRSASAWIRDPRKATARRRTSSASSSRATSRAA